MSGTHVCCFYPRTIDVPHTIFICATARPQTACLLLSALLSSDLKRYTRNLVDEGNGKFNLMILCWNEGHASAIHDHADSHCFMKMLRGSLCEVRYAWPKDATVNEDDKADIANGNSLEENEYTSDELEEISRTTLEKNGVCYINDTLGLHRVENPSHSDVAVSLHLYCPPFDTCSIFNKQTGKRTKCKVTFWSKYGKREQQDI
ncbi:cysteine dioxygenase 1 isoform X2 [Wyeomyia smithii]|uniref:cysteine dioxygenase 1 isoform X2 n=1 Tax=Wyeomyia smithii TaxID=174621 RepID=UPI002467F974|nr:cysteine dioxygenase 1 isoform X2 [Wyeomyia smithii]